MPPIDAPTWWADVQQDREDLGGRRAPESWLDEDLEFVPRRRFPRAETHTREVVLHGVFVHAESAPVVREEPAIDATVVELEREPAADGRRTVHITGRPESRALAPRPRRARTAADRIGHRPDKVAMWAVVLGALLILLAFTSADSHAATHAAGLLAR